MALDAVQQYFYIQGAHASPPTPLHEKDIAISYGIQTVMLFMSFLDGIVVAVHRRCFVVCRGRVRVLSRVSS